ncbi:uncharacterized protein LOC100572142 [Acyrthosiphon pisum]|uniref:Regulatory protein zeste n=2 Tax=Macrosiphini TaxID=33386 RepID=A0A8R2H6F0_ACYPI|nr:uncharacterized protein LOC100572142 [Acyrthosiphon pisum]|eukprot:XP_016656081.1 PREDICTED: uncharacterized protein LOC100572142 [Acyrthosiphon pisum]
MKRIATQSISQNDEQEINQKKSRQGRRNDKQLTFMVDYMVQHPHVATGKFRTINGKNDLEGSWDELMQHLNNLRNPGVKEKNTKSWKESWRDLKTKVSKKASVLRNSRRQTGNKHIQFNELTEMDNKVLGIVGFDYVEGTTCPDSWPEELDNDVEQLANGDISILNIVPTPLTIRPNHDEHNMNDANDLNSYTVEILDNILEVSQQMSPTCESVPQIAVPDFCTSFTPDNSLATQPLFSNITTATNSKKKKCDVKLNTQFSNAREIFTNLAKTSNQQIELLTNSLSMIAESNIQMAAAITKMAENDEKRLLVDEQLVNLLSATISKLN